MQTALGADADQMFGKNRMKEDGFDVDGDGQIEDEELLDLQRLNYSTPGGWRRGEMQVPAGGFSRYAQAMTNKAKAERVRREAKERLLLGSPHAPKDTRVFSESGDVTTIRSWAGSDLVSGSGALQPLVKENGAQPTRVFVAQKRTDARLKNHETKDHAKITSRVALPKKLTAPSGTVNPRSPLSGSHTSDEFASAHDAFTKDEHIERARLNALNGQPHPHEAPTPEAEERVQAAITCTSRSSPYGVLESNPVVEALFSLFGIPTSPKTPMASPEEMSARRKASSEKLYPEGYNGVYTAVVQETNAQHAEETRETVAVWKEELENNETQYMDKAKESRTAVYSGREKAELAKEEMLRARQMEADEIKRETLRLERMARDNMDADQKTRNQRAAQSFDERYLTIEEMVSTLQSFSPEEASLTPRSAYTMEPSSRSPREAYLKPFEGLNDQVAKDNAALFARIRSISARTDDDVSDDAAGAARASLAAQSKARKKEQAKKLAAHSKAIKERIASVQSVVDADYDETPLDRND